MAEHPRLALFLSRNQALTRPATVAGHHRRWLRALERQNLRTAASAERSARRPVSASLFPGELPSLTIVA